MLRNKRKSTGIMKSEILCCSNAIHRGDILNMKRKNNLTTNGFRNGTVIFFIIMLFALASHFLGNL